MVTLQKEQPTPGKPGPSSPPPPAHWEAAVTQVQSESLWEQTVLCWVTHGPPPALSPREPTWSPRLSDLWPRWKSVLGEGMPVLSRSLVFLHPDPCGHNSEVVMAVTFTHSLIHSSHSVSLSPTPPRGPVRMGARSQQAQGEMGAARVCKQEPTLTPRARLLLELRDSFVLASSPPSLFSSFIIS